MLEIQAEDFLLRLIPSARRVEGHGGPYLDWIELGVEIQVPGFEGTTQWQVMPAELERFRDEVTRLSQAPESGHEARLAGVERGFVLCLQAAGHGGIVGTFEVQANPPEGATLRGSFGLDQTYLPGISKQIDTLLEFS